MRIFKNHSLALRVGSWSSLLTVLCWIMTSCNPYPGFDRTDSGIFRRLDKFGDCSPTIADADFFVMKVSYKKADAPDSGYSFLLHYHNIRIAPNEGKRPGLRLMEQLSSMECGDAISLILPFSEFEDSYIGAYADTSNYKLTDEMLLSLDLQKTFDVQSYRNYLMSMAQHDEIPEADAIELYLRNTSESFEKHGDCYIHFAKKMNGDSIKAGREVSLEWNTFLFNGEQLDDTTYMQFTFGKPGQLISGFQYALSFLGEGDEAIIYLPSYLAFGEKGSSSGIVPARTPIYFNVKVNCVMTENEMKAMLVKPKMKIEWCTGA